MASINNKPQAEQPQQEDNILETIKAKKGIIIGSILAIIVVIVLIFVGKSSCASKQRKSTEAYFPTVLKTIQNPGDSTIVADLEVAAQSGGDAAEVAKLNLAIHYYNEGNYEAAIAQLNAAEPGSNIIEAGKFSLLGDCYVNTDKLDNALDAFNKAIKAADGNVQIIPAVLIKEANVYREKQEYAKEAECYKQVFTQYPEYARNLPFDIRKYQVAAETKAAQ